VLLTGTTPSGAYERVTNILVRSLLFHVAIERSTPERRTQSPLLLKTVTERDITETVAHVVRRMHRVYGEDVNFDASWDRFLTLYYLVVFCASIRARFFL
jgi:hypothetical protein